MSGFDVVGVSPSVAQTIHKAAAAVLNAPSDTQPEELKALKAEVRKLADEFGVGQWNCVKEALKK